MTAARTYSFVKTSRFRVTQGKAWLWHASLSYGYWVTVRRAS